MSLVSYQTLMCSNVSYMPRDHLHNGGVLYTLGQSIRIHIYVSDLGLENYYFDIR